ncbi:MAG: DUF1287 domain-containing protein [Candidatus Aureabacteria bacterium]|nr:DUF1287 domain-containing protein [Candidatus Auribacterota bacterium]
MMMRVFNKDLIYIISGGRWIFFCLLFSFIITAACPKILQLEEPANQSALKDFIEGAKQLTKRKIQYDPSYCRINYPGGDIPSDKGVCTDLVIRAFRNAGVDIQKELYEHLQSNFNLYMLNFEEGEVPDPSIDHRRVRNLMVYFRNKAIELPVTRRSRDYLPGDIVVWKINNKLHIGIVVDLPSKNRPNRYMIAHHSIKSGPKVQDMLFAWKMVGHYRYF